MARRFRLMVILVFALQVIGTSAQAPAPPPAPNPNAVSAVEYVIAPNMFAGSILDLQPDTAYEAQFVLADPDGVRGESRRVVTVSTRPEPKPYEGGRVFHVYPHGFKGQKTDPSFEGLMCAYNY